MFAAFLRFALTAAAVPLCAEFMDGVHVVEMSNAIIVGIVLGLVFTLLRPVMRLILSVINFCTLGLLNVVLDAWLVWTAAKCIQNSVVFESFWWAVAVAVVINAARMLVDVLKGEMRR